MKHSTDLVDRIVNYDSYTGAKRIGDQDIDWQFADRHIRHTYNFSRLRLFSIKWRRMFHQRSNPE
jgi:hypothetical protein